MLAGAACGSDDRRPLATEPSPPTAAKSPMVTDAPTAPPRPGSSFRDLFTPKLVSVLREGYGLRDLRADALSGLTVAVVALPLSMAIAIASGVTPDRGLYSAIVGGFLVSLLGGSRFQIGGPAGAFIVLVAATVAQHGVDGMLIATMLAGLMLLGIGFLRLGTYVKFIPFPVTVGFTAGIAVIIFASQIKDLLGLSLSEPEPGELIEKLPVLWHAIGTINAAAVALAIGSIGIIAAVRRWRPSWPGMLIAVAVASAATAIFNLPVETIGSRFGGIPSGLPLPSLPNFTFEKVQAVLPNAVSFALLGAIESLLSAVVADGMTGRRHRSNCELVAQGVANIAAALFGGICVTGTIARTATNVRAGARGPISGMLHSTFLLGFMLVAAPLAAFIPLAALAGVLAVVAWNMAERHQFALLLRSGRGDAVVLLATFLLTIFRDLTEGIVVGFSLGAVLFIARMAQVTGVEAHTPVVTADRADDANGDRRPYDAEAARDGIVIYRITGAFFFGAAAAVGAVLENFADRHRALVIDFSAVPFLDSTAANTVAGVARKSTRRGVPVSITGASVTVRQSLLKQGVRPPLVEYHGSIEEAVAAVEAPVEATA
jgi:SulP family sulfate permease